MSRNGAAAILSAVGLVTMPVAAAAAQTHDDPPPRFTPGAAGLGDPYYPLDGNGGYDVLHYDLDVTYDPATDVLTGEATITATATQDLSAFNLDLQGLQVRSVEVDGRDATWSRRGQELTITPAEGIRDGRELEVEIEYDGVPQTIVDQFGLSGFMPTDDGAVVTGQPHVAATWFPANDHPLDEASYRFEVTVPEGLEAVANGALVDRDTDDGWTTWTWDAEEPMESYLTVLAVGVLDIDAYEADGIRYWDAVDPDLRDRLAPREGDQAAISQASDATYTRLTRVLSVPAGGATLSFWADRQTQPDADYLAVEARPAGTQEWTTLEVAGRTTQATGTSCPAWLSVHPFLGHYQTASGQTCTPTGSTGRWWAASGASDGYERWTVDLGAYAGRDVEVSLSYITDETSTHPGVVVDDIEVSTGEGSTSFEDDGDTLDGWTVTGPPPGSPAATKGWIVGTADQAPPPVGDEVDAVLARQPQMTAFLADLFGPYPFDVSGAIVDDYYGLQFAMETQTRSIYAPGFFTIPQLGEAVVVHELAHQWTGDLLTLERWQHIWLHEGFASYTEWLWREAEGIETAQAAFDARAAIPANDPFWQVRIGDPGTDKLFDAAVYERGAMTLHALRLEVGDETFRRIVREWVDTYRGEHVSTDEFIAVAESVSGRQLDDLFRTWLFTPSKPAGIGSARAR